MAYTYRYIGDLPRVFIDIQKDGHTWEPSHGDEITLRSPLPFSHPWLQPVVKYVPVVEAPVVEAADSVPVVEVPKVVPAFKVLDKTLVADTDEDKTPPTPLMP